MRTMASRGCGKSQSGGGSCAAARPRAAAGTPARAGRRARRADAATQRAARRAAATLTSQQVTQYRAGTSGGEPDAASLLATSLNNLSTRLGALGRREEALAAIQEAVTIRRELAARWPDAYQQELEKSLRVRAWLEHGDASPQSLRRDNSALGPYIQDRSIAVSSRLIWVTSVPPPIQARSKSGCFGNSVHTRS
jgi:hypothetical protein